MLVRDSSENCQVLPGSTRFCQVLPVWVTRIAGPPSDRSARRAGRYDAAAATETTSAERPGIDRLDVVQKRRHPPRRHEGQGERRDDADCADGEAVRQHQSKNIRRRSAKGLANAELSRALHDALRHHAVDANHGTLFTMRIRRFLWPTCSRSTQELAHHVLINFFWRAASTNPMRRSASRAHARRPSAVIR